MAFSQVDPARLQGDARWYLRSPADIEAERATIAAQAYRAFYSQGDRGPKADTGIALPTATAAPGARDYWTPRGCANCHGYTPDTLPPIGGASDSAICGRLRNPDDIRICRSTASERSAFCRRRDGFIGFPSLETRGGRR